MVWVGRALLHDLLLSLRLSDFFFLDFNEDMYLSQKNAVYKDVIFQNLCKGSFSFSLCNVPLCYV